MTTAQYQKRKEFKQLSREVKPLRDKLSASLISDAATKRELDNQKKFTIRIGVERGFYDQPLHMLTVAIHPQEFKYAMAFDSSRGGFQNVSMRAEMIAREMADKVVNLLVEFCHPKALEGAKS